MGEIKTNDLQEVKSPAVEGFKEIKPVENTKVSEAASFWNDSFDSMNHSREQIIDEHVEQEDNLKSNLENEKPICIKTINDYLENKTHPETRVLFERRIVELPGGKKIEGVFPKFDSLFDAKIDESLYLESNYKQFKECNRQLLNAIESNLELKAKFTDEQIEQIKEGVSDGTSPDGYVWHHDAEAGKIQLVEFDKHSITKHTGGRCIWGGGYGN